MIEKNLIPKEATWYHILPFDKVGKDPGVCGSKRPISLLNAMYKLYALIIRFRLEKGVERYIMKTQFGLKL